MPFASLVIMLVDDQKIICVGSDVSTRPSLKAFYDYTRRHKTQVKFTAYEDSGCYKVLRSKIKSLHNMQSMAKLISSRYETVQFSNLHHFFRFWHEVMAHTDPCTQPFEFKVSPGNLLGNPCPLGNLTCRPSNVAPGHSLPRELLPGEEYGNKYTERSQTRLDGPHLSSLVLCTGSLQCVASDLLWEKTPESRKDLFRHLDTLHKWVTSRGKVLKVISPTTNSSLM